MHLKRNLTLLLMISLTVFVLSGTAYALLTTHGSSLVLRTVLKYQMNVSRFVMGGTSGNIWHGMELRDVEIDDFQTFDLTGDVTIQSISLHLSWKGMSPSIAVEAKSIFSQFDQHLQSVSIQNLQFKEGLLNLHSIVIQNIALIKGENTTNIESISAQIPISERNTVKVSNASIKTTFGTFSSLQIQGNNLKSTLENIEISLIPHLPNESVIQIQKIEVSQPYDLSHITSIENGRLHLTGSDTILFYTTQNEEQFNGNVYSKTVELEPILTKIKPLVGVKAAVGEVDLQLSGSTSESNIQGTMNVEYLSYRRFYLTNNPALVITLNLKKVENTYELVGKVDLSGGEIVHKKIKLHLEPGMIVFKGNPEAPEFDLKANAKISNTTIYIQVKGTADHPDVSLSSSPPYPEEKILIMLVTGKEWSGTEKSIREGKLSADTAREFVDYFVFGGKGDKLAQKFGIKKVSLQTDETTKGIEIKKSVSRKVDVGIGLEKKNTETEFGTTAKKLAIDYNVSSDTLVSVEGKVESKDATAESLSKQDLAHDASVTMELKKSF